MNIRDVRIFIDIYILETYGINAIDVTKYVAKATATSCNDTIPCYRRKT